MTKRDVGMQEYLKALREVSGPVPDAEVDWDAIHRRLDAAAELPLARLRHAGDGMPAPNAVRPERDAVWWEVVARWSRATLPFAAAATIVLGFVIRSSPHLEEYVAMDVAPATASSGEGARDAFVSAVIGRGEVGAAASLLLPATSDLIAGGAASAERR
jgi:hypothetical protein